MRSNISEIRNRLFQPYDMRGRKRKGHMIVKRRCVYCAISTGEGNFKVCWTWFKKIVLQCDDNEEAVVQKIMSAEESEEGDVVGFPKLKLAGGFELLKSSQNCRSLSVLNAIGQSK